MSASIDIAIIGGGSSGMSLAANLANLADPPNVRIFEPKTEIERDCHWGFWATAQQRNKLRPAIKGEWQRWQLMDHKHKIVHDGSSFTYAVLSSSRYLKLCREQLNASVQLVRNAVDSVEHKNKFALLKAGESSYKASQVFDSRPPLTTKGGLIQHFVGREIRTQDPIPQSDVVTLMDFRVDQSRGLHFIYMLPFSETHILVESTMISSSLEPQEWYLDAINRWLDDHDIKIASQIALETGAIPMHDTQPQDPKNLAIGAAGGAMRQSSGYSFSYIQKQTSELAGRIKRGCYDVPNPVSKKLLYMDRLFNRVLEDNPDLAVSLFMDMAAALDGEQFARFMMGNASLIDWVKVILAMPKTPFLRNMLSV